MSTTFKLRPSKRKPSLPFAALSTRRALRPSRHPQRRGQDGHLRRALPQGRAQVRAHSRPSRRALKQGRGQDRAISGIIPALEKG